MTEVESSLNILQELQEFWSVFEVSESYVYQQFWTFNRIHEMS